MSFISKYLTHSRFLFNCLLNFNKVRTVRNINAFPYTSATNVHANRPHRNMIFADIARVDPLLLNIKLNKAFINSLGFNHREKKTYMRTDTFYVQTDGTSSKDRPSLRSFLWIFNRALISTGPSLFSKAYPTK